MPSESLPEKPGFIVHVFQNRHGLWFAECKTSRGHGRFQISKYTKREAVAWALRFLWLELQQEPSRTNQSAANYKFIYYEPGELPPYVPKGSC